MSTLSETSSQGKKRKSSISNMSSSSPATSKSKKPKSEPPVASVDTPTTSSPSGSALIDLDTPKAGPSDLAKVAKRAASESLGDAEMEGEGFVVVKSKEERRKEKKLKKETKLRLANGPEFLYNTDGFRSGKWIGVSHIRDLVLHIVTEHNTPTWMVIRNRPSITHTLLLLVPGLLPSHLSLPPFTSALPFATSAPSSSPHHLPLIPRLFSHACPVRAPGDTRRLFSVLQGLLQVPLSAGERQRREREKVKKIGAMEGLDEENGDPRAYVLTPNEMLDNEYPLPSYLPLGDEVWLPAERIEAAKDVGGGQREDLRKKLDERKVDGLWVETPLPAIGEEGDDQRGYKVLALDCEMCKAGVKTVLARVSIIDFETGKKVLDELVIPEFEITDYLTRFSGITASKLSQATLTHPEIQSLLLTRFLTPRTILLGHSLECDLSALRVRHPLCIDTSVMFKHPRGAPYKSSLKYLAKQWLGRVIQAGGEEGHDSEEDARACADLLREKLRNGPSWGETDNKTESIFERMSRHAANSASKGRSAAVCDYGNPAQWHGKKARTAVACKEDDDVVNGVMANIGSHDFVFGRLMELSTVLGWTTSNVEDKLGKVVEPETADPNAPKPGPSDSDVSAALVALNDRLQLIYDSLPTNTAFIIMTGHADPRPAIALNDRKANFDRMYKALGIDGLKGLKQEEKWLSGDDRLLEAAAAEAREGMAFFCVK